MVAAQKSQSERQVYLNQITGKQFGVWSDRLLSKLTEYPVVFLRGDYETYYDPINDTCWYYKDEFDAIRKILDDGKATRQAKEKARRAQGCQFEKANGRTKENEG